MIKKLNKESRGIEGKMEKRVGEDSTIMAFHACSISTSSPVYSQSF